MPLPRFVSLSAAVALLAGCSMGGAFVDRQYLTGTLEVSKPKIAGYTGEVRVCYDGDTTVAERDRLANEACEQWGLAAVQTNTQRWQCRILEPHLAIYTCVDPQMRYEDGSYVNPFNQGQVEAWRRQHAAPPATDAPSP